MAPHDLLEMAAVSDALVSPVPASRRNEQECRKPMFSQHWYRVADLKPRLVQHVHISRQEFRGQEWFILRHHLEGR